MLTRLAISLIVFSCCVWSQGFDPGCTLPFKAIQTTDLNIDATCTIDGNSGPNKAKKLESNAKNNFCVTGKPVTISYDDFSSLQDASDGIDGLKQTLKTDRSVLADLVKVKTKKVGEGTLVQFVAFLLDAHNSNVSKGELVNCGTRGKESNDVHIELVNTAGEDDACQSVTAEMSPHFMPETWSDLVNLTIKRPVRITGPMFFDGSHVPCHDDVRPNPNRISVWEIHPVYKFDVCKNTTLASCKADADVWIPLDKWHPHEEDPETPQQ